MRGIIVIEGKEWPVDVDCIPIRGNFGFTNRPPIPQRLLGFCGTCLCSKAADALQSALPELPLEVELRLHPGEPKQKICKVKVTCASLEGDTLKLSYEPV